MTKEKIIKKLEDCELNPCVSEDREIVDYAIRCIKTIDNITQEIFNAIDSIPITLSRKDADNLLKRNIQDIIDKHLKKGDQI